jgi:hypothetical protein
LAESAGAVVVFHEDFSQRAWQLNMLGKQPNVVDDPSESNPFLASPGVPAINKPGLGGASLTSIDYYGTPAGDNPNFGLLLKPQDAVGEMAACCEFQTMYWPVGLPDDRYTFGTDRVKITIVARQAAPPGEEPHWNGFAFGFADTDYNLSNMIRLEHNESVMNPHRTRIEITHNSIIGGNFNSTTYGRNAVPGWTTHEFATMEWEYDPNKLATGPYKFTYNGQDVPLNVNLINLQPMTNSGGAFASGFSGIAFGFWNSNALLGDRSVLIKEIKLETLPPITGEDGDYDNNGTVDAADYVLWRKGGALQHEVADIGTVSPQDYTEWRQRFGNGASGSGLASGGTVPEPASLGLVLIGLSFVLAGRTARTP